MSYVRLLRLPPQSEAVSLQCRRNLSARSSKCGSSTEQARVVWQHRRVRARKHASSWAGGDDVLDAAFAEVALGKRGCGQVRTPLECVVDGGGGRNTAATASAILRMVSAAPEAAETLQTRPARGTGLVMHSTRPNHPLPLWGEALRTGWSRGAGGTTVGVQSQSQSLRGFASAAPPDPSTKASPDSKRAGERAGPGRRASLGDLLKPSDVRGSHLGRGHCIDCVIWLSFHQVRVALRSI